jgi:hypothetical protein
MRVSVLAPYLGSLAKKIKLLLEQASVCAPIPACIEPSYDDFASWGPCWSELEAARNGLGPSLNLPTPLADALESVHRAAHHAGFIRHFIGGNLYLEKPLEDAEKTVQKLHFDVLPNARRSYRIVEGELIAVRQQIPSAHAVALAYAEAIASAVTLRIADFESPKDAQWRAMSDRLKMVPSPNGRDITNAMKVEAIDAATARKSRSAAAPTQPAVAPAIVAGSGSDKAEPVALAKPRLNETDKKAARYIRENPGCKGESLALGIAVTPEHFRSRIFPKLRAYGYSNEGGYRPPKRLNKTMT